MLVYLRLKQDYINLFLQATSEVLLKLASKIWSHFVQNLQRYDTISAHVPKRAWQFASENFSIREWPLYKGLYLEKYSVCFFMFCAILKATNNSFQNDMTFCRSIYVKKVVKLLTFIFEQSSYLVVTCWERADLLAVVCGVLL